MAILPLLMQWHPLLLPSAACACQLADAFCVMIWPCTSKSKRSRLRTGQKKSPSAQTTADGDGRLARISCTIVFASVPSADLRRKKSHRPRPNYFTSASATILFPMATCIKQTPACFSKTADGLIITSEKSPRKYIDAAFPNTNRGG